MGFLRNITEDYLELPKNIRNGIVVLLCLLFLSISFTFIYKEIFIKPLFFTPEEITALENASIKLDAPESKIPTQIKKNKFDPNEAGENIWTLQGIPSWLAKRIVNYTSKGGHFNSEKDLLRIYGFNAKHLEMVKDQMFFKIPINIKKDTVLKKKYPEKFAFIKKQIELIELNTADSASLVKLPGIGPVYASRILKYRNRLGGFYSKNQLKEVYELPVGTIELINSKIIADSTKLHKINLKTSPMSLLGNHPYITFKRVKLLEKLRKIEPEFTNEDLQKNNIFTSEELNRLAPYLE